MPFTLAHPAIVLPLLFRTRRWLSMSGLVLGAMAPDFEYFFRLQAYGSYGHTWLGMLWFNLPTSLLIAGLFHGLVKRPLVRCLPLFLRARLSWLAEKPWSLRNLWSSRMLLGIIIGSVSHVFWDAFTHSDTVISVNIKGLELWVGPFTLYRWLQYISSVVGLLAVAWFVWRLPKHSRLVKATSKIQRLFWTLNGVLTTIFWLLFLFVHESYGRSLLVASIVTGISAFSLAQILTSAVMWRYFHPSKQARAARALKREIAHEFVDKQPHS
ncbi:DUF4184 family protein [Hymenobacter roseosalivarius]|nr:DUF4184 family protein [Hymenobacter roseosalivarius]